MRQDEYSNFFYSALLILGAVFAVINIRTGIKNLRAKNQDYAALLKENAALKKRNDELQKMISQ